MSLVHGDDEECIRYYRAVLYELWLYVRDLVVLTVLITVAITALTAALNTWAIALTFPPWLFEGLTIALLPLNLLAVIHCGDWRFKLGKLLDKYRDRVEQGGDVPRSIEYGIRRYGTVHMLRVTLTIVQAVTLSLAIHHAISWAIHVAAAT